MTIRDLTHTTGYQRPPLAARLATYAAGALAGGIATASGVPRDDVGADMSDGNTWVSIPGWREPFGPAISEYEQNARRHEAKAAAWEADGKPDYAAGSRAKAAKWRARGDRYAEVMRVPHGLEDYLEEYVRKISHAFLHGTSKP